MTNWPPRKAVCVGAVVMNQAAILFVRQAPGTSLAGQWSIPWGIVDEGERPEAAAVRETLEEGGITAELVGLLGMQNLRPTDWLSLIFLCQHVQGIPTDDGGIETDAAAYFSLAELIDLSEPIDPFCEWLARRVLQGRYQRLLP